MLSERPDAPWRLVAGESRTLGRSFFPVAAPMTGLSRRDHSLTDLGFLLVARIQVTIPVHCVACGTDAVLTAVDWPSAIEPVAFEPREVPKEHRRQWTCPTCSVSNHIGLLGRLVSVSATHRQ